MGQDRRDDELLEHVDVDRRRFIGRLMVGSALATPVVSSFSMRGVNAVFAQDTNVSGVQSSTASTSSSTTSTTAGANTTTTTDGANTVDGGNTTDGANTTDASDSVVN